MYYTVLAAQKNKECVIRNHKTSKNMKHTACNDKNLNVLRAKPRSSEDDYTIILSPPAPYSYRGAREPNDDYYLNKNLNYFIFDQSL